jgi:hypothetical protein
MRDAVIEVVATVVVTAIVFGVIGLFGWLVGGGSRKASDGAVVLRYGRKSRGLAVMMVVIALALCVVLGASLIGVGPNADARMPILLMIGLFGGLGLPLAVEAFRRQVVMNDEGLTGRGWFATGELLRWEEIVSVERKVVSGKFVVRTGAVKLVIGHDLEGLSEFVAECKKRLAPDVYGDCFDKPINRPFL